MQDETKDNSMVKPISSLMMERHVDDNGKLKSVDSSARHLDKFASDGPGFPAVSSSALSFDIADMSASLSSGNFWPSASAEEGLMQQSFHGFHAFNAGGYALSMNNNNSALNSTSGAGTLGAPPKAPVGGGYSQVPNLIGGLSTGPNHFSQQRRALTAQHNAQLYPRQPIYPQSGWNSSPGPWSGTQQQQSLSPWTAALQQQRSRLPQPAASGSNGGQKVNPQLTFNQTSAISNFIAQSRFRRGNWHFSPPSNYSGHLFEHAYSNIGMSDHQENNHGMNYQDARNGVDGMRFDASHVADLARLNGTEGCVDGLSKGGCAYIKPEDRHIMGDGMATLEHGMGNLDLSFCGPNLSLHRFDRPEHYSRKVFVGGLPPDIDEEEITSAFRRFGPLVVDWPHKAESKSYFPPKGYCFLLFQEEISVQSLVDVCLQDDSKIYWCVTSPTMKDKPVQIRPWNLSDSDYVMDASHPLDPRKTIFVGGVPRPLRAGELAMIMDRLYGCVCYAGIDTDPELKYPKGAGRVAFSNQQSYIAAISARFVQLQHGDIDKRVEVKPYVLDDQMCDECQGSRCGAKFAPFFCANVTCLQYYCEYCWSQIHSRPGREYHKPLVKEGADRPRAVPFRWC